MQWKNSGSTSSLGGIWIFLKNSSPTEGDLTNNFSRNVEIIVLLGNSYWFAPQSRLYSGDQVETLRMRTSFCLFLSELEGRFSPLQLFIDPAMALGWLGGSRSCQKFQNFSIRSQILCLLMTFLINSLKYFEFSALFSFKLPLRGNWVIELSSGLSAVERNEVVASNLSRVPDAFRLYSADVFGLFFSLKWIEWMQKRSVSD